MNFTLRPYQEQTIKLLREAFQNGSRRPILCLPTGAGKTVTFSQIADAATKKGNRVLVVCHRKELIEQAKKTMQAYGVDLLRVTFGMVQTLQRNQQQIPSCSVCIVDECHTGNFRKFVEMLPPSTMIIGATATPISATKKNPLRNTFTDVIAPVSITDLVDAGYLAKPLHKLAKIDTSRLQVGSNGEFTTESQDAVYTDLIDNIDLAYQNRIGKTIIFCSSIKTSIKVAERLGVAFVHSQMTDFERDKIVANFKKTPAATIVNCGILTAGFDDPQIETVIVFRATTSLALWLQMCGRGSRVTESKHTFQIIDMGNNVERHGAWHLDRDWKYIFENEGKKLSTKEAPYKNCVNEECNALILASARVCNVCGQIQPTKEKTPPKVTSLQDLEYNPQPLPSHLRKPWSEMDVEELVERAQIGSTKTGTPYKIGWIVNQIKQHPKRSAIAMLKELAILKGYSEGWVFHQSKTL